MKKTPVGTRVYGRKAVDGDWRAIDGVVIDIAANGSLKLQSSQMIDYYMPEDVDVLPVAAWCRIYDISTEQLDSARSNWFYYNGRYETPEGVVNCNTFAKWLKPAFPLNGDK